jgi:hypothetical protein
MIPGVSPAACLKVAAFDGAVISKLRAATPIAAMLFLYLIVIFCTSDS